MKKVTKAEKTPFDLVSTILKEVYEAKYGTKNRSRLILLLTDLADKISEPLWELSVQHGRDMHKNPFTEAICPHGVGHHKGVHGCDGCCAFWPKHISKKVGKD